MSTITFIGTGTPSTANNGGAVTPIPHASTTVGDLMVVAASVRNSGTGVPNTPTGYKPLLVFGNVGIFARFYQAGDGTPSVSFTGGTTGDDTIGQILTFRGVSPEALIAPYLTNTLLNGSAQNVAYPALPVAKDRHLALLAVWKQADSATITSPPTTSSGGTVMATAGNDATQSLRYVAQTAAAAIASGTLTVTGGVAAISRALWVALKPAASISVLTQDVYPPRVLVSVTDLTLGDAVALYRQVSGVRTLVQAGAVDAVTDPSFLRIDAQLPFGVPVSYVADVNGVEYSTAPVTYTLPGGSVVISDAIGGLAAEVRIGAWPEKAHDLAATVFRPGGRNVIVSGDFGQWEGDLEFYTETTAAAEQLRLVLAAATQGVVQMRQPGGYDGVDSYYAITSYRERRYSQDGSDQKRLHVVHAAEVDGWAPALAAGGFTYADLAAAYTGLTYANLAADYATYLALAQGDFS
jgi:hypothetical protein